MNTKSKLLFFLLSLLAVILFCTLQGCSILKDKVSVSKDTAHVAKVDSGGVKSSAGQTKNDNQWTKETIVYGNSRDTINNVTNVYPTTVIRESGSSSNQSSFQNYDSGWKKGIDSLAAKMEEDRKTKKESALTTGQLIGAGFAILAIGFLLSKIVAFKNPFSSPLKSISNDKQVL